MQSIKLEHDDFQSTKNGFLTIASIVAILFLIVNIWVGLLAILVTVTLWTLTVGIEIDPENRKYRYFKSFYGKASGKWENIDKYQAVIVLRKNMKGQMLSPKLVNELSFKHIVFDVNLATKSHRTKLSLKKYRSIDDAMDLAKSLSKELNMPLEKYDPVISERTRNRRRNRK